MESSNQFSLETGIKTWRSDLRNQGSLDSNDLDELENHLRESIEDLQSEELSLDEAFIVAKRRIGKPSDLRAEFQKVNPGRLWSTRVCWMLVGYLSFTIVGSLASLFSKLAVFSSFAMGLQSAVASVSGIAILIVTWLIFLRFLAKRCTSTEPKGALPLSGALNRHPFAAATSIGMLYLALYVLGQVITVYFTRTLMGDPSKEIANLFMIQALLSPGMTCLLLVGTILGIQKLRIAGS